MYEHLGCRRRSRYRSPFAADVRYDKCADTWLTMSKCVAYITKTRCAAARRNGAPPKLFTFNGDLPPTLVGGNGFVGSPAYLGRGCLCAPGCLTGESEERETWTAESLRAGCMCVAILKK